MTHAVEWDTQGRFVRVITDGLFDETGYQAMVDDILSRPFWRPGLPVLFDHRKLSFADSTLTLMRRATKYHAAHDDRIGDGKAAVVMSSTADYGVGRQFEALLSGRADARLNIFREVEDALAWLSEA